MQWLQPLSNIFWRRCSQPISEPVLINAVTIRVINPSFCASKIQKIRMIKIFLLLLSLTIVTSYASAQSFPYAEPVEHGFSAARLDTLRQHLVESGSSSLMIVVDGEIIFEYGKVDRPRLDRGFHPSVLPVQSWLRHCLRDALVRAGT